MRMVFAMAAASTLAACTVAEPEEIAAEQIAEFHQNLNSGDLDSIWENIDASVRAETPREEFDAFIVLVRDNMGDIVESEQTGSSSENSDGVNTLEVTMETVYENGEATETFTFHETDGEVSMVFWNMDSDAMLAAILEESFNEDSVLNADADVSIEASEVQRGPAAD